MAAYRTSLGSRADRQSWSGSAARRASVQVDSTRYDKMRSVFEAFGAESIVIDYLEGSEVHSLLANVASGKRRHKVVY